MRACVRAVGLHDTMMDGGHQGNSLRYAVVGGTTLAVACALCHGGGTTLAVACALCQRVC